MPVEIYEPVFKAAKGRYSPADRSSIRKTKIEAELDFARGLTSPVDRQNLSVRMPMRRFARPTNAWAVAAE